MRALIIAYSCEPGRGSEPGAGWGLVAAAASFADCVVLVGPEHADALERYRVAHPGLRARFVAVPGPRWGRWLGRNRVGRFVAYLGWMRRAAAAGRRLTAAEPFDLVHHATFSVYWLRTAAVDLGLPSVLGPVGGAVTTPRRLWPLLGWGGLAAEVIDLVGVRAGALLPATRRTWQRATVRIAQNEATRDRLPRRLRAATEVWNHAEFVEVPPRPPLPPTGRLLWAGALESRKGPRLAILALAETTAEVALIVVGDGPQRRKLERLARRLDVAERVDFRGRVARPELAALMAGAAAAVFTGLREEGGLALAEALVVGTPVIVLDNGGAATVARAATDPDRVVLVAPGTVAGTARRLGAAMARVAARPPGNAGPLLDQAAARSALRAAYERAARS